MTTKTAVKAPSFSPGRLKRKLAAREKIVVKASRGVEESIALGPLWLDVEAVAVGSARNVMPQLIRDSATGRAFLIRNAKSPTAASALLINPEVLQERLIKWKPRRTLGQVLDSLPFKRLGAPRLKTIDLPDDEAPALVIRGKAK
jgi:hypothetical protein